MFPCPAGCTIERTGPHRHDRHSSSTLLQNEAHHGANYPRDRHAVVCGTSLVRQIVLGQVKALHGAKGGDLKHAQIAVCTIEKANGLVNRMAAADVRCLRHRSCCWRWLLVGLVACEPGLAQTVVPIVVPTCFFGVVVGCKCLLQKCVWVFVHRSTGRPPVTTGRR